MQLLVSVVLGKARDSFLQLQSLAGGKANKASRYFSVIALQASLTSVANGFYAVCGDF